MHTQATPPQTAQPEWPDDPREKLYQPRNDTITVSITCAINGQTYIQKDSQLHGSSLLMSYDLLRKALRTVHLIEDLEREQQENHTLSLFKENA